MKFIILLLIFTVTSITHLHAYPADAAADATNTTSKVKDGVLGAPKASNVTDISKLMKDGHGPVNPVDIAKQGTEFMSTVISACENFIKSLFKLMSPGSSTPGDLSKLTSIFNPGDVANLSKNMMDNVLKVFKLSPPSLAGADALSKAKDVLPATDPMKNIPKDIPSKDAASSALSAASNAISSPLSLFGV